MAMTPEGRVKAKVKERLKALGAYYHCPVQNGMGDPALDFHCCVPFVVTPEMVGQTVGMYVGIETKAEGNSLTPRQRVVAERIRSARGIVLELVGLAAVEGMAFEIIWSKSNGK